MIANSEDPYDVLLDLDDFKPFEYPIFGSESNVFMDSEPSEK